MKVYIIANKTQTSLATAELTRDSAMYHEGYEPFIIKSKNGNEAEDLFDKLKIIKNPKYPEHSDGAKGCFISHFMLWQECININEPIIICEHDALFINNWTNPDYKEILHLNCNGSLVRNTKWHEAATNDKIALILENSVYRMNFVPFDYPDQASMPCAYAYAIKPMAAMKLINDTLQNGYFYVDRFIRESLVEIETIHPPLAQEQLTSLYISTTT